MNILFSKMRLVLVQACKVYYKFTLVFILFMYYITIYLVEKLLYYNSNFVKNDTKFMLIYVQSNLDKKVILLQNTLLKKEK